MVSSIIVQTDFSIKTGATWIKGVGVVSVTGTEGVLPGLISDQSLEHLSFFLDSSWSLMLQGDFFLPTTHDTKI